MKAGLQQIPIQGAAPRLAGNREWDGLPMPTRFWAILAVAFGVSLSVIFFVGKPDYAKDGCQVGCVEVHQLSG